MTGSVKASRTVARMALPSYASVLLLAAAIALLPVDRRLAMEMLLAFAMAQGWNLLAGYTGLLSFGHHAFVGLGAYVLYMTVNGAGVSPYLSLLVSAGASVAIALAMWGLLSRQRGAYFSIGVWVLADSLRLLFAQWDWVGSSRGIVLNPTSIDPATLSDNVFYLALALAVVTHLAVFTLLRRRTGLALAAVRDNESGAASVGIAVAHNQLMAFLVSAAVCGLAGGIYYLSVLYVDPSGAFDIDWQIRMLFIAIVGGIGTLEGPIIGVLIYFGLREVFRDAGDLFLIFQGLTAMLVMLLAPGGVWGFVQRHTRFQLFPTRWIAE